MYDQDERGEHHRIIPVVYTAAAAAFILHKPGLEGAEEENADHIADRVEEGYYDKDTRIDDAGEIEDGYRTVKRDPYKEGDERALRAREIRLVHICRSEVASKLLLTPHTLKARGEEAQDHLRDEEHPDENKKPPIVLECTEHGIRVSEDCAEDVADYRE